MKNLRIKLGALLCFFCMAAGTVQAGAIVDTDLLDTLIVGGIFSVVSDGNVIAEYRGSQAGYFNTLYFDGRKIFDKNNEFDRRNEQGDLSDLGLFSAGDVLVFELHVRQTGLTFRSGAGDDNPDGLAHFRAISSAVGDGFLTTVGVEDLLGGGDQDFNDFIFSLTNVIDPPAVEVEPAEVPEPPVLFLLSCGVLGLVARRRRAA